MQPGENGSKHPQIRQYNLNWKCHLQFDGTHTIMKTWIFFMVSSQLQYVDWSIQNSMLQAAMSVYEALLL